MAGLDNTYIWGTTISVSATERAARDFMEGFVPEADMGEDTRSKYTKLVKQVSLVGTRRSVFGASVGRWRAELRGRATGAG